MARPKPHRQGGLKPCVQKTGCGTLPQYAPRIGKVIKRLWDLHPAIREYVYHPEFYGSFSLKAVLPALVPHMTYQGMDVADGIQAGLFYEKLIKDNLNFPEYSKIRKALLDYCKQDSLAMAELIKVIHNL